MNNSGWESENVMNLLLKDELPFVSATVVYDGAILAVDNVLVDTGSATTIFAIDSLSALDIAPLPDDTLHVIRGIGGSEAVFSRRIDSLTVGERSVHNLEIEVGGMDYGFDINGILGMDFLQLAEAVIDLGSLTISFANDS